MPVQWSPNRPISKCAITDTGDTTTVVVVGEIDLATSTRLNRELDTVLDRVPPPVLLRIDLGGVGFMDTTGVAILLKARRRCLEVGCRFNVIATSPTIARLFEITGLAGLLAGLGGAEAPQGGSAESAQRRNSLRPVSCSSRSNGPSGTTAIAGLAAEHLDLPDRAHQRAQARSSRRTRAR